MARDRRNQRTELNITSPVQGEEMKALEKISGRGLPNSRVAVAIDSLTPLAANADQNGLWTIVNPFELKPGSHTIEARSWMYGHVRRALVQFEITLPRREETVSLPEIFYPVRNSRINGREITVVGRGTPGHTVSLKIPGGPRTEVDVLENGSWSAVFQGPFTPGHYILTARQTNQRGESSPEIWEEFFIEPEKDE